MALNVIDNEKLQRLMRSEEPASSIRLHLLSGNAKYAGSSFYS